MGSAAEIEKFADRLRELKERSGRSYGALARRLHVSTSTLHRYCNGDAVPADYAPVERLARLCAAAPNEREELHRLWLRADAARRAPTGRGTGPRGPGARPAASSAPASPPRPDPAPPAPPAPAPPVPPGAAVPVRADAGTSPHPDPTSPARPGPVPAARPRTAPPGHPDPAPPAHPGTAADSDADAVDRRAEPDAGRAPDADGGPATDGGAAADRAPSAGRGADTGRGADAGPGPAAGGGAAAGHGSEVGPHLRPPARPRTGPDRPAAPHADPVAVRARAARLRERRGVLWATTGALIAATVLGVAVARSASDDPGTGRAIRDAGPGRVGAPGSAAPPRPDARAEQPSGEAGERAPEGGRGAEGQAGERAGEKRSGGASQQPATQAPRRRPAPSTAPPTTGAPRPGGTPPGRGPRTGVGTPLTLSTRSHVWENGCDHRYLIDREPAQVAPPPVEQDAPGWAAAHGAVHGGRTIVEVTVAGRGSRAVVLRGLQVRVVGRQAPLAWSSFAMENGCGGSLTPRSFAVDLDAPRPLAKPTDGYDGRQTLPAVRFPYRVSATDPEVLRIDARTVNCDCRWYLELDWTSGDRQGTVRIDDAGQPFRTSGRKGRPEYGYWSSEGGWLRNDP